MSAKGFSLIECLIYCAVASCLSVMAFAFFNRTITGVHLFANRQHEILGHWSAQQLLRKDIQMASAQAADWHIKNSVLICKVNGECIEWQLNNNNLYRSKGNYNFRSHQWEKKNTALVAKGVTYFEIVSAMNHQFITSISYDLAIGKITLHKTMCLANGIQERV